MRLLLSVVRCVFYSCPDNVRYRYVFCSISNVEPLTPDGLTVSRVSNLLITGSAIAHMNQPNLENEGECRCAMHFFFFENETKFPFLLKYYPVLSFFVIVFLVMFKHSSYSKF
jgi:hypothetical protein